MKKIIVYLIVLIGLIGLALNSAIARENLAFLENIPDTYLLGISLLILAVGIVILIITGKSKKGKISLSDDEVPIYEGKGKKRKIIGYRTD